MLKCSSIAIQHFCGTGDGEGSEIGARKDGRTPLNLAENPENGGNRKGSSRDSGLSGTLIEKFNSTEPTFRISVPMALGAIDAR